MTQKIEVIGRKHKLANRKCSYSEESNFNIQKLMWLMLMFLGYLVINPQKTNHRITCVFIYILIITS